MYFPVIWVSQSVRGKECVCDLKNVDPPFPKNELTEVETTALQCIETITLEKVKKKKKRCLNYTFSPLIIFNSIAF